MKSALMFKLWQSYVEQSQSMSFKTRNYDCQEETRYLRLNLVNKTGKEITKYATNKGRNLKQIYSTYRTLRTSSSSARQSGSQLILRERERERKFEVMTVNKRQKRKR